ncbi:TPA: hypothetical protein RZK51_000793 [Campylobacter coli]|nr:hypothetical protein [Campylobacter coli]HEB9430012.1 hypothetical protein [Campylobacter coli]
MDEKKNKDLGLNPILEGCTSPAMCKIDIKKKIQDGVSSPKMIKPKELKPKETKNN